MINQNRFKLVLTGSCSALAMMFGIAAASADTAPTQVADAAPETAAGSSQIEEIVVTAQKRSENAQDVPIAVAQISPAAVANFGALKTDDLAVAVPGLQIQHEINSATAFIRGVGPNSNGSGEESSVAVYLDDLYIESGDASIFSLNAISSIQVLKGPQGTIFGRNATGGVIQVQTQDPSFTPSLDAHAGYGNYNTKAGDIYVTGPIIPGILAANAAVIENDESAGWGRDVVTGERAFTSNDWAARVKFLFTPTDTTRILLSMNYMYTRGEVGLGFNQVPSYIAQGAPLLATGAGYVGWYNTQDYKNDVSVDKNAVIELRADQETPWAKFVNILGWQRYSGYAQFAQDASPADLIATKLYQGGRELTEEFQILNPADASYASWLTWITGAYYLHDDAGYPEAQLRGSAFGFPVTLPGNLYLLLNDNVTTTSVAGFGQGTVKLLPNLGLTVGARYTRDERVFTGGVYLPPALGGGPAGVPTTAETPGADKTYNLMTYRASLDYHFTDDLMAYFAFNRGVKSGQFDTFGTGSAGVATNPAVAPEVLLSYEVGAKTEFLDHHVRLNLDAFHYDISNLQFAVIVAGGTKLVNAAGAEINGGEADLTLKLIDNLTVSGGISVQQGHYTSFPNAPAYFSPGTGFQINAAGNPTVHTPEFTGNLNVDYTIPVSFGDFDVNANYTHTASFQFFPDETLQQPETDIVNASILWTAPTGQYDIRAWGANLTGQQYYAFGSESLGLGKQFSPAAPRTYGVTLGVHFTIPEAPQADAAPLPPMPAAAAPAPAPTPEAARQFQVFFDFDKSNITEAAARVIQAAADVVKAGGIAHITVTGHTDTVGTARYNQGLSERRAASVKTQLVSDGVSGGEVSTVGVGKTGLLVPTKDGVREPQNRRAVIDLQ